MIILPTKWQSRRTCAHLLLQGVQNNNSLLNNQQQKNVQFGSFKSLSHVQLYVTPWTAACQASLSSTGHEM